MKNSINNGMKISEAIDTNIEYHDTLNSSLWSDDGKMHEDIRKSLIDIANLFYEQLDHKPKVIDIIVMGSMANYNWSKHSDIDLHLVVDIDDVEKEGLVFKDYLQAQKVIWNKNHDITIKGYDVEIYVQDVMEKYHSAGVYSLKNSTWISKPVMFKPTIDDSQIVKKAEYLAREIELIDETDCTNLKRIERLIAKIRKMRQDGLDSGGEFSVGNLVFKVLRNNEYLDILYKKSNTATDSCYSVK